MTSNNPMYSCITCRLLVSSPESQRVHYQSDWHRYNLKRKIASLPPVSLDLFIDKASAQNALLLAAESVKQSNWNCNVCRKHFSSQNQMENHMSSKRHRSSTASLNNPTQPKSVSAVSEELDATTGGDNGEVSDPEPLDTNECLFAQLIAQKEVHIFSTCISLMDFFIPFLDYATDITGILQLLAALVGEFYGCIYCVNRYFSSVEAAQHHMRDKSHCKLNPDDSERFCDQFSAFYDFSSSYPDQDQASSSDPPSDNGLKIARDMSLILPSGAIAGHRAFKHVYKQNLRPSMSRSLVSANLPAYNDSSYLMKLRCMRETKRVVSLKKKSDMRLGIKANKLQPYLRKQC